MICRVQQKESSSKVGWLYQTPRDRRSFSPVGKAVKLATACAISVWSSHNREEGKKGERKTGEEPKGVNYDKRRSLSGGGGRRRGRKRKLIKRKAETFSLL